MIKLETMRALVIPALIGVLCAISRADAPTVSVSCMMAYDEGGAPAVLSSLECPYQFFKADSSTNVMRKCQFASLQGHREYQEDRVSCNLLLKLPFSVEDGPEEIMVGIVAVFDGHGGQEASEMGSRKLLDYFSVHAVLTAYKRVLASANGVHNSDTIKSSRITVPTIDRNSLLQILEEALLGTVRDIDSEFSKEALENGYISGSTATIVLLINGQFLVANLGDTKAIICSQKALPRSDSKGGSSIEVHAEELTRDHHPDREDEKARIEASGGYVKKWGVPRVNGILAVSRAIGDVPLKRYGVTANPEITGWRTFSPECTYLVVASDGVFETLSPQNVCEFIHYKVFEPSSLADWIVRHAFMTGSSDNLSAIVVPLFIDGE